MKLTIFFKLIQGQVGIRSVTEVSLIPQTTTYRIITMTEHLLLKPYKGQFVQQLYEEDFQGRVEMYCHY